MVRRRGWFLLAALGGVLVASFRIPTSDTSFTGVRANGANSFASGLLSTPDPVSCAWTGANSLSFSWTNTSALADGYEVERSNLLASGYAALATVTPASSVTTTDSNPAPPTVRYYRVNSYAGVNWQSASTTGLASSACDLAISTVVTISDPTGLAVDSAGNLFTTSSSGNRVYKTTPGGVTTTFAGTGTSGYSGDGGAATSAQLGDPKDLAIDASDNLYFVERANSVVRKVTAAGVISTVAGNGLSGYTGDGGPATSARLFGPYGLHLMPDGTIYIGDSSNHVVRKVSPGGTITTVAGNGLSGYTGDGGAATSARLNFPYDVVVDDSGNLIIADTNNQILRRVTPGGTISTFAGNGATTSCAYSGSLTGFSSNQPKRMAFDSVTDRIFLPDAGRNCVRVLTASAVSPLVGTGTASSTGDGGPAESATLQGPTVVAFAPNGNLYIGDGSGNVRRVLQV